MELPAFGKSIYEHKELSDFIRDLRGNEIAMIPRLQGLAEIKGTGVGIRFLNLHGLPWNP